ncbi:hypothetical protein RJ639_002789 [Escallonia herrerae]|uniref:Uncharacterized protein n=1 Tax=Escallonia herrerae TaxID=1293975 RepID=A0AA88W1E0_9ASTE|nr:hypothetical protein RJ639_002789 [Escallonia herrerae]
MAPDLPCHLTLLLLLLLSSALLTPSVSPPIHDNTNTTISPSPSPTKQPSPPTKSPPTTTTSTLDPKQLRALQSLDIPTSKDPCSQPSLHNATTCDSSSPFRHLLSLRLSNCSGDLPLSTTALKALSTLTSLSLVHCPTPTAPRFPPPSPPTSARSHPRLVNLTDLTVSGTAVNSSSPSIFLNNLKYLHSVTITHANLTGSLPKRWHLNITHIDLSGNNLKGKIPTSLTLLENLEHLNLSSNALNGEIPTSFGDLISLQNVSLASNSLSGPIPDSFTAMPGLVHLDLGSNHFNGTIPKFITEMKGLKYLNLEKNSFHGVMPFNGSFIKRLEVFKVGGNSDLCYNHSTISSKVKLGIAPCDKHGLPILPPPAKDSSGGGGGGGGGESSNDDYSVGEEQGQKSEHHHGPRIKWDITQLVRTSSVDLHKYTEH